MANHATIIIDEPIIEVLAEMKLRTSGVMAMAEWVKRYRPKCVPEGGFREVVDLLPHDGFEPGKYGRAPNAYWSAFCDRIGQDVLQNAGKSCPECGDRGGHDGRQVTDNELLCELAGRACYSSFAEQGAKRTNAEYLASMWTGRGVPHRSTGYHSQFTFFIAHVSRRVSHELIRNYVGAAREEEGIPSQESTRFTEHTGVYVAHPRFLQPFVDGTDLNPLTNPNSQLAQFKRTCEDNYQMYLNYVSQAEGLKGMDRKRVYEAASSLLLQSCATSFIWTTNCMALTKLFIERCDEASDLEMQRLAKKWKRLCLGQWPNLFPGLS